MLATLKVAVVASVLALAVGVVFALLRLSPKRIISVPATIVLEFFRGVPVLLPHLRDLPPLLGTRSVRSGPSSSASPSTTAWCSRRSSAPASSLCPRASGEAAMAIGLRPGQVMSLVLMPQARGR